MTEVPNNQNLDGLAALANRDGVDIRPTLLRVMTDLYVQKPTHTEQEDRQFAELSLRLIDLVDAKTRAIVAGKIAGYPKAPTVVRQRLLKEHIAFIPPAERADASDDPFAGSRAAAEELSELFFAATAEERRLILLNLPYATFPSAEPVAAAAAREATLRLEAAALGHNSEAFGREIETTLAISRERAQQIIDDAGGEPIVIVAAALGMPATVLQRILLCLNPAISQSVQRVYELALLHEDVEPAAALRLVAIWQAANRAETPATTRRAPHQPVLAPAEPPGRGDIANRPKLRWDELARSKAESA